VRNDVLELQYQPQHSQSRFGLGNAFAVFVSCSSALLTYVPWVQTHKPVESVESVCTPRRMPQRCGSEPQPTKIGSIGTPRYVDSASCRWHVILPFFDLIGSSDHIKFFLSKYACSTFRFLITSVQFAFSLKMLQRKPQSRNLQNVMSNLQDNKSRIALGLRCSRYVRSIEDKHCLLVQFSAPKWLSRRLIPSTERLHRMSPI
jgi:hypothetical protein